LRFAAILLLLAGAAAAQDYEQAKAVCAEAREIRRREGYVKAIEFLEPRLDHPKIVAAYADCCLWAGEEERGLRGLRASKVPANQRAEAEISLLVRLFRYDEAAEVAREHGWTEAAEWWGAAAALRDRLHARARRAGWIAALGVALLLGAWALMRSRFSSARATS
jgi:hypothetical protein